MFSMKKKYLSVESIFIFFSIFTFLLTMFFRFHGIKNFRRLEHTFSEYRTIANRTAWKDLSDIQNRLEKECLPYSKFDSFIEWSLSNLVAYSVYDMEKFSFELDQIQSKIRNRELDISFSYDSLLLSSLIPALISIIVIILKQNKKQAESERLEALRTEQIAFSRDLHDGVAQDLAAIKIYLAKKDLDTCQFYAEKAFKEVRYLIDSMRIEYRGDTESVIREILAAFASYQGIKTNIIATSNYISQINSEYQREILYIIQESLSNIARHAHASEVRIRITDVGSEMHLAISDNGIGFNEEEAKAKNDGRKHYGLKNIAERVANMKGTVQFINDGGTTIAITIKNPVS